MKEDTTETDEGRAHALPDPYGSGFQRTEDPVARTREKWEQQEQLRLKMGKFATYPVLIGLRILFGFSVAFMALTSILFPEVAFQNVLIVALIWGLPLIFSILPPTLAGEALWQSIQARISLRENAFDPKQGQQSLRSQPGMDRILEGLTDVRRHNYVNAFLAIGSLTLLILGGVVRNDTVVWNLSQLIAMTLGFGQSFHALFTSDIVRQQGDEMPCLIHHAPTHHPTQLGSILGELIVLHLDPDLYLEWMEWMQEFYASMLPGYPQQQSWERLLYILHLHAQDILDDAQATQEIHEFIRPDASSGLLLDSKSRFNWRSLQRLIEHARVWQPSAFRLLERLQIDLLSGNPHMIRSNWRMDVALDETCYDGIGHLFIALNNQSFEQNVARVKVVCPGGEPFVRDHRFELQPCPPPRGPVQLQGVGEDDALDWVPRYLQKGVVLWLGVAWPNRMKGEQFVQVVLEDEAGLVLESQILRTQIVSTYGGQSRHKKMQLERARHWATLAMPKVKQELQPML